MKTKILSPLRRDGYKAGMIMMLIALSTMLLTTACSSEDDALNNTANTENTINKGYALPVTVNVTREGDAGTRATFDGSKLAFSAGDKLFVEGLDAGGAGSFAGTLNYVSGGTFSGTIYTQNKWPGTADDLFTAASADGFVDATLLPAGYDRYKFLSIDDQGTSEKYDDEVSISRANAFVASATAKKTGVEQLSWEQAYTYSSGFALEPQYAVLNFTITGLEAGAQDVTLQVTDGTNGNSYSVTGSVTPNASGVATFAVGVPDYTHIRDVANYLTIGSSNFTLPSNIHFDAGKIYNITRGTGATVDLSTKKSDYTAQNGETLTGTLASNVQISIADGATVILNNVTINGTNDSNWAGITCVGDATIILSGTNTVKGFYEDYPGIYVPSDKTLVIKGTGSLTASGNGCGAGIGGGFHIACGNIEIQDGIVTATGGNAAGIGGGQNVSCGTITISGGTVNATGGDGSAGIGSSLEPGASCGNITISGGTVNATGGEGSAGIGSGSNQASCGAITISGGTVNATGGNYAAGIGSGISAASCGAITITTGVTKVTATKGGDSSSTNSIGAGSDGKCGTVTIGGTVYWGQKAGDPSVYEYKNGGDTYLPTSPLVYPAP